MFFTLCGFQISIYAICQRGEVVDHGQVVHQQIAEGAPLANLLPHTLLNLTFACLVVEEKGLFDFQAVDLAVLGHVKLVDQSVSDLVAADLIIS